MASPSMTSSDLNLLPSEHHLNKLKHEQPYLLPATNLETGLTHDHANSVRTIDADGRLHVARTPISKANICPYLGQEIPDWRRLKLDPERIYHLLRDPGELSKAIKSFNALPILETHHPVTATNPRRDLIIGTTGQETTFEAPFLINSLVIWDGTAIERIFSGQQRELSCAYTYVPIMKPGVYNDQKYDGVMTQIRGSHVALVPKGRAGPDVLVADTASSLLLGKNIMNQQQSTPQGEPAPHLSPTSQETLQQETPKNKTEPEHSLDELICHAVEEALATERKRHREADEARRTVRPLVGDILGMDSADEIYRYALRQQGLDASTVHPSALAGMVSLVLKQQHHSSTGMPHHAMDSTALSKVDSTPRNVFSVTAPRKL